MPPHRLSTTTAMAYRGDPGYADATSVFNLAAPARPIAATTARDIDQIQHAIRFAKRKGAPLRVMTTGHAAAASPPIHDSLLVRTELAEEPTIDAARRTARIPAGTPWGAVIDAAAAHGLAAPHGSSPLVGAIGYLLRGGISFYGRQTGVAANSVRAIELVTADGELRRVDADHDPDLFWALRGGGGGFGIVTAVEIALFPATQVITGASYWPVAHARELLDTWLRWTITAPRQVTTSLRVMNLPEIPEIPAELSAGPVVCIDGAALDDATTGHTTLRQNASDLLEPLRRIADPLLDTWHEASPAAVADTHMDPTEPFEIYGDHLLLDELGDDGAEAFLSAVVGDGSRSPVTSAELRQLGGALAEPHPAGGALDHIDGRFGFLAGGVPFGTITPSDVTRRCALIREGLRPWDTRRTVPTFVESFRQPQRHLSEAKIATLDQIRLRVDPEGLFRDDITPNATALR